MLWFRLDEKPTGRMRPDKRKAPAWPWFIGSPKRYDCEYLRGPRGQRYAHVAELEKAYNERLKRYHFASAKAVMARADGRRDEWYIIKKDGAA